METHYRKYQTWRDKRYSEFLNKKWPEIRKNGRTIFTIKKSFLYACFWSIGINLYNAIFVGEKLFISGLLIGLIVGFIGGLLLSDGEWARNEARYLKEPDNKKID
jgi:hypothetical protein